MSKFRRIIPVQKLIYILLISVLVFQGLHINVPKALASDTTPPTLISLSFSKSSVDTTSGSDSIIVTASFEDNTPNSPISTEGYFSINFLSPSGEQMTGSTFNDDTCRRVVYLNGSGSCQTTVPFKQFIESGTWTAYIYVRDPAGNSTNMNGSDLAASGFSNSVNVTSGVADTTSPTLTSLSFSKSTIDTNSTSDVITVTATFADEAPSGTGQFGITFSSPTGQQIASSTFNDDSCRRVVYLNGSGSCTTTVPFKQFIESGTWTASLGIEDPNGNHRDMSSSDLSSGGFPNSVSVTSGTPDLTPPTLTSLTFSKSSVNTTLAPDLITVTATFIDEAPAGGTGYFGIVFSSPTGQIASSTFNDDSCRRAAYINGSATCITHVPFKQFIESGTWTASVGINDPHGNHRDMSSSDLSSGGFPNSVSVTSN